MDEKVLSHYNSAKGLADYTTKFQRHRTERINNWHEQRLIRSLLRSASIATVNGCALDLPCGYGRLYPIVREVCHHVVEGDWSFPLLSAAKASQQSGQQGGNGTGYVRATAMKLPFIDGAFDFVLSVRLCHHIREHQERIQYLKELMRVSSRFLLVTYIDYQSMKNRWYEYRRRFNGKRPKWTLDYKEVEELSRANGFEIVKSLWLSRFFSGHRYVLLRKIDGRSLV
jgi:SAM-dependent methyltransferase